MTYMQHNTLAISLLLTTLSFHVSAQEDFDLEDLYADDEFVSIATGTTKSIRLAPSVASVITANDIKNAGAIEIEQVLEMVPGLHISRSPINRLNTVFSMRGVQTTNNAQIILLIDGVELFDQFNHSRFNRLKVPVSAIQRIEVIRGPGSAVHGADAFAGVINIITKSARDINGTEISALAGSFDTYGASMLYGNTFQSGWDVMANVEYQTSQGDDERVIRYDLFGDKGGKLETDYEILNGQLKVKNEYGLTLDFKTMHMLDSGLGQGAALVADPKGDTKWQYYQLKADYSFDINDEVTAEISGYSTYFKDKNNLQLLPPNSTIPIGEDGNLCLPEDNGKRCNINGYVNFSDGMVGTPGGKQTTNQFSITTYYLGAKYHLIRAQFGYINRYSDVFEKKNFGPGILDFDTVGNINSGLVVDGTLTDVTGSKFIYTKNTKRDIIYLSLQDEWQISTDWELTLGVRYDHYSDFGDTLNPRLALVWEADYNLTTKFLYGRAFRAPSVSEKFAINNPAIIGNDNLEPETIDTWEIALDYRPTISSQVQFNIFSYQIKDLIDVDSNKVYQNSMNQEGYGYEVEYHLEVNESLDVSAGFAWQHSENRESNEETPLAPGRQLSLSAHWDIAEGWHFSPMLHWVADRKRSRADALASFGRSSRPTIKDYTRVDFALRNDTLLPHTDLIFSVTNLLDDNDIAEPSSSAINDDYKEEGRKLLMQVKYHFFD